MATPQQRGILDTAELIQDELDAKTEPGRRMRVVFEEIIDLTSGALLGYEALTRVISHPSLRISPERWFAKARSLGVTAKLEARAVELALDSAPKGNALLSVNFSPDCLHEPEVQHALDRLARLDRMAVVELAEHHHVDTQEFMWAIEGVRERGILLAVDDAGTGQSGPEFVHEIGPDIIKIDRSHVSDVHRNPEQRGFVHQFAEIADSSQSMIIVEGVSSSHIADTLAELGSKWGLDFHGQGYWLSRHHAAKTQLSSEVAS